METWLPWVTLFGTVLGLATLAGAVLAFIRTSYLRATIETLKESNQAYESRLSQVEAEVVHYRAISDRLTAENAILRDALSGKQDFQHLQAIVESHHEDLRRALADVKHLLNARRAGE